MQGAGQISSNAQFCRIYAAFRSRWWYLKDAPKLQSGYQRGWSFDDYDAWRRVLTVLTPVRQKNGTFYDKSVVRNNSRRFYRIVIFANISVWSMVLPAVTLNSGVAAATDKPPDSRTCPMIKMIQSAPQLWT
jgi:hypothetical protein